ncbi:MAG: VOC family protein [Desulfobacteria bacterium]|jgi:catechol 2,3-dioxygenase-like lactoylglutathione lyase family enzyme
MKLNHAALVCSSEQRADHFYEGVLELRKIKSFLLSRELARQIFEIEGECQVLVYGDSLFTVEVFLATPAPGRETSFEHICFEVKNIEKFLNRCEAMQVEVNRVPKGDRLLTFVKDYDGNMFEIKDMTGTE